MDVPEVAILLATYNGEKFLEQQLESIFAQKYLNFKIYVSDDSSTDATVDILKRFQVRYPQKFFYTVNKSNIGFVKNFEKLLYQCESMYIAFCDQDDIWDPQKLYLQVETMKTLEKRCNNKPCLVHSDLSMIDENGKLLRSSYFRYRKYKIKKTKDLGHIVGPNGIMGNTLLINQKLKKLVLPFPNQLDLHDYWIALNCELFGCRETLTKPLTHYRIHTENFSNSQHILEKKKFHFNRDIKLPNLETKRKYFLPQLLQKVQNSYDKEVISAYLDYLYFKKNRLRVYLNLLRFQLVKRDIWFQIKLLFKILLTNRY